MKPIISFIIPTYNKAPFLKKLLESLCLLNGDQTQFEIIVVNDGSTDTTEKVVKDFFDRLPLKYVSLPHQGVSPTRNEGLRHAQAELVAFLSDDYILPRNYLENMLPVFENHEVMVVKPLLTIAENDLLHRSRLLSYRYHMAECFFETLPQRTHTAAPIVFPSKPSRFFHATEVSGAAIARRTVYQRFGNFREDLASAEDSELGERIARAGIRIWLQPQVEVQIAFHSSLWASLKRSFTYGTNWLLYHQLIGRTVYSPPNTYRWLRSQRRQMRKAKTLARYARNRTEALLLLPYLYLHLAASSYGLFKAHRRNAI